MAALGIPAHDELRVRTALVVRRDLRGAIGGAFFDGLAVRRLERVIELNVLVVAAVEPVADGGDELALASWVGLVVPAREEDVHALAVCVACGLARGDDRGTRGQWQRSGEEGESRREG